MKILSLMRLVAAQAFYRWAMREIDPLHPDVPKIMHHQMRLADKRSRLAIGPLSL